MKMFWYQYFFHQPTAELSVKANDYAFIENLWSDWSPGYDATEALKIVDYVYFIADGVIAGEGATADVKVSEDPFVHQFIRGRPDGPVPFHYPSGSYADDLNMTESNTRAIQ